MRLAGALVLLLLAAAPARADTFGELPFQPVAGVATCLRATGAPGEIARWTEEGVELMHAGAAGLAATDAVRLGDAYACPEVASQPNGAAVVAITVRDRQRWVVRVAVRDPGGRFGAPVALTVPVSSAVDVLSLAVAVSPAGDALVAVRRTDLLKRATRLYAFRRPAGGAFLAPGIVTDMRDEFLPYGLAAGADAGGRFTLARE
jgi:hypothetical protein